MPRPRSPLILAILILNSISFPALAQITTRVSVSSAGVQANGSSTSPSISSDGQVVAFDSAATNLVTLDTNIVRDVFRHDRTVGTTVRVSVNSSGARGSGTSSLPVISGNGQVIAFVSSAANLVSGDTNGVLDIFAHDVMAGLTVRVSVSSSGTQGDGHSTLASISADGRFIAFESQATNLVPGDTNGFSDIFVRDLATGVVERISVDSFGSQSNGESYDPSLSGNGRFVAFTSHATSLGVVDTNEVSDVYVFDRLNAAVVRASVSTGGLQGNSGSESPAVSHDGRYVTFSSTATTLVTEDTNNRADIFVRDTTTNLTSRVSIAAAGHQNSGTSSAPSISSDGQLITYLSVNGNVLQSGTPSDWILAGPSGAVLLRVGTASGGALSGSASSLTLSGSGTLVAFASSGASLVSSDTNGAEDVFVSDFGAPPSVAYCLGDGTATACPCGNTSAVGTESGCLNSTGGAGRLTTIGYPNVANDTLVLDAAGMNNGPCLYFQGTGQFAAGLGSVLGDGLRCAAGTVIRLEIMTNIGGASQYPRIGDPLVSVKGMCVPGAVRTYQVWYRDAMSFCTPETYNLTNGIALAWRP